MLASSAGLDEDPPVAERLDRIAAIQSHPCWWSNTSAEVELQGRHREFRQFLKLCLRS